MEDRTYDLGVVHETLGHDFRSAEFTAADEHVDVGTVLGQICQDVVTGFTKIVKERFMRPYKSPLLLQSHHRR
jgi:hypothetical protein